MQNQSTDDRQTVCSAFKICPAYNYNLCCAQQAGTNEQKTGVEAQDYMIAARRTLWRASDRVDGVPIVCRGWAANSITTTDGRRQILTFILPGDIVSTSFIFDLVSHGTVEAITDVHYRLIDRTAFETAIREDPKKFSFISKLWVDESALANRLAFDLGQRSADERIASLILGLADRLNNRGLVQNSIMEFPLRQHHIADATGLTSVHAGKVLSDFRRNGLIELNDRTLTLTKPNELRHIADLY